DRPFDLFVVEHHAHQVLDLAKDSVQEIVVVDGLPETLILFPGDLRHSWYPSEQIWVRRRKTKAFSTFGQWAHRSAIIRHADRGRTCGLSIQWTVSQITIRIRSGLQGVLAMDGAVLIDT